MTNNSINRHTKPLLVYRASAGSGKTFTLAARYIALLLTGIPFRSILAVTFTNKATAEMKERIIEHLYKISTGEIDATHPFTQKMREFTTDDSFITHMKANAKRVLTEILNDYDHFAISTIDAFLQILLAGLAQKLHLRANYEVDLDQKTAISDAVDYLIANIKEEESVIMTKVKSYFEEKIEDKTSSQIIKSIKELGKEIFKEEYLKHEDIINDSVDDFKKVTNYKEQLNHLLDNHTCIVDLIDEFNSLYGNGFLKKGIENYIKENLDKLSHDVQNLKNSKEYITFTSTKMDIIKDPDLWLQKACTSNGNPENENARQKLLTILDEYKKIKNLSHSISLSTQNLNDMCLLRRVKELINEMEHQKNSILLATTPVILKKEADSGDAPFILEKAGIRYNHIMIDEFQDTSGIQWHSFKPLIEEILSKEGGTVLLVGDVKQSIYRWRNGDWKLLEEIDTKTLANFFEQGRGEVVPQKMNFRSHEKIVQFNLSLFKFIAEKLATEQTAFEKAKEKDVSMPHSKKRNEIINIFDEGYTPEKIEEFFDTTDENNKNKHKGGYVQVRIYQKNDNTDGNQEKTNEKMLIRDMFDSIKQLTEQQGIPMTDITILVRNNKDAEKIAEWLSHNTTDNGSGPYDHLKVVSSEAYKLENSTSVKILINALNYLITKNSISLFYLASRYQNEILGNNVSWEEIRLQKEKLLPQEFTSRERALEMPLYELMEWLARIFLYDEQGERPLKDDSFVFAFFDELTAFIQKADASAEDFMEHWETDIAVKSINGTSNGIQILTIHKAKGLQNQNVFIPLCHWPVFNKHFSSNLLWCSPKENPYSSIPHLPVQLKNEMNESIYKNDYEEELFMTKMDFINTLYVAFTRAQKNLFISALTNKDGTTPASYLQEFFRTSEAKAQFNYEIKPNYIEYCSGEFIPTTSRQKNNELPLTLRNLKERFTFRQSNESFEFLFPNEDTYDTSAAKHGLQLHLIYSSIRVKEDTVRVIDTYRKQGIIESDEQEAEISKTIANSWSNPQASEWFDGSWTLFPECSIIGKDNNGVIRKFRPDRVMIKGNTAIVVDFKFARYQEEHETQVRNYMNLMKDMGYRDIKGYLWYINTQKNHIKEVSL